jgi:spore germination protein KC
LLTLLVAISMCGCWDYNDPDDLLYITGMAFDRAPNGRIHATIEFSTVKGESMMKSPTYMEIEGDTFYDTLRNSEKVSERQINNSHVQIVIVSQEIAKNSMDDLLDMLLRLPQTRDTLVPLVSKEATAGEVMKATNPAGDLNSFFIMGSLKGEKQLEKAPYIRLYEFADTAADEMQSAILPAVGLVDMGGQKMVEVSGTAVFRGPWLQGFLDEYDTRTMMMLDFHQNMYDLPLPADPGGKFSSASVEFILEKMDVEPDFSGGRASVDVYIRGSVVPVEISGASTDPAQFCTVTNAILAATSTTLESDVKSVIMHSQQLGGCDVLCIGNKLQDHKPEVWRKINGQWREYYNNMDVNVKAGLNLRNTGDQIQPLTKGD